MGGENPIMTYEDLNVLYKIKEDLTIISIKPSFIKIRYTTKKNAASLVVVAPPPKEDANTCHTVFKN